MVAGYQLVPFLEQFTGVGDELTDPFERYNIAVRKLVDEGKLHLHGKVITSTIVKKLHKPKKKKPERPKGGTATTGDAQVFYESYAWRNLRYKILLKYGKKCMCCEAEIGPFHVDHIKPLRKNWGLRLDPNNLQVLCGVCNHGKGNWDETDHRPPSQLPDARARVRLKVVSILDRNR